MIISSVIILKIDVFISIKHPSEFIKLGENLDVIVMEQDLENRRLALSHKDIKKEDFPLLMNPIFLKNL